MNWMRLGWKALNILLLFLPELLRLGVDKLRGCKKCKELKCEEHSS